MRVEGSAYDVYMLARFLDEQDRVMKARADQGVPFSGLISLTVGDCVGSSGNNIPRDDWPFLFEIIQIRLAVRLPSAANAVLRAVPDFTGIRPGTPLGGVIRFTKDSADGVRFRGGRVDGNAVHALETGSAIEKEADALVGSMGGVPTDRELAEHMHRSVMGLCRGWCRSEDWQDVFVLLRRAAEDSLRISSSNDPLIRRIADCEPSPGYWAKHFRP